MSSASTLTFTQGLIVGQASFLILCLLFIRYVVFSPSEELDGDSWKRKRDERLKKKVLSNNAVPAPPASHLLLKTGYEMATHPAESTGWMNVILAQVLQGYRNDLLSAGGEEGARQRIEKWLNPDNGAMSWLDPIEVNALSLGTSFPLLSNARIRPADGQGHIRAEIDVDYSDSLSLSLSTSVLINFPRPRFAVLPVSLGVELASIGGTLSLQIHDPGKDEQQHLHACLLPDFHLHLKTTTLLGSRAKLQDIPKLEQLILSRIRSVIQDRFVHPNHLSLALPRILKSSQSPTPNGIVSDIGQAAVNAMGEALTNSLKTFVVEDTDFPTQDTSMASSSHIPSVIDTNEMTPRSPPRTGPQRKITMPAGFPNGFSSQFASPIQTPQPPRAPESLPYEPRRPHIPTAPRSGYGHVAGTPSVAYSSASRPAPSHYQSMSVDEKSSFRFRGQFSSQPGTPGLVEQRHMGALNSRAG